jgi:hypothetical protein
MGSIVDATRNSIMACGFGAALAGLVPGAIIGVVAVCVMLFLLEA